MNWIEEDGTEKEAKDLRVGEVSFFYPYRVRVQSFREIES
jgi:hypothetical protein